MSHSGSTWAVLLGRGILILFGVLVGILLISNLDKGFVQLPDKQIGFRFSQYLHAVGALAVQYAHGDWGGLVFHKLPNRMFAIGPYLGNWVQRSLLNLIPSLTFGLVSGYALALLATWKQGIGKWLDKLQFALLGVPDFLIVVLLQTGAILWAKAVGHKVLTVLQFGNDIPVLIPFLSISILPGVLVYGTLRLAIAREWEAAYISTAMSKGVARTSILFRHILRNTTPDLLAAMPRTIAVGITSLVVVEVMSSIFGLGGYALNPSLIKVTSLPVTCAMFAVFALLGNGLLFMVREKWVIRHENGGLGNRIPAYTMRDHRLHRLSCALLLLLVFVIVCGSALMPHSITDANKIYYEQVKVDGVLTYVLPPLPPSRTFWFGTDIRGYDVLSLLLNGGKYTIGFALGVTVLRFLLALPLGLGVGLTGKGRKFVSTMQLITSSVPTLIFVYPALYSLFPTNSPPGSMVNRVFMAVMFGMLVFFGLFQIAQQFSERAHFYGDNLFILAARTMGASGWRLIFRHLLPLLRAELLFAFLVEFVQVMFLLGQLAVLGIFIGGGELYFLTPEDMLPMTTTGEWGGMIAYGAREIRSSPWILLATSLVYTLSVWVVLFFATQVQKRLVQPGVSRNRNARRTKAFAWAGGLAYVAVLLVVSLGTPGSGAHDRGTVSTQAQPGYRVPPAKQQDVQAKVQQFMGYLQQGNWEFAATYLDQFQLKTPPRPPAPYDSWVSAFSKQGYKFVGIQAISQKSQADPMIASLDVTDPSARHLTLQLEFDSIGYRITKVKALTPKSP